MGQIVTIFITILVVSVIAAMTFLFIGSLKDQVVTNTRTTIGVTNETIAFGDTAIATIANSEAIEFTTWNATLVLNRTFDDAFFTNDTLTEGVDYQINSANGTMINLTATWNRSDVTYNYNAISDANKNAYVATNTTESAGITVVGFLSILFLALIFSAILTVVMRFVLPFLNLGNQLGGF